VFRRLTDAKFIAFDVETTGLDWKTKEICGYVITFDKHDSVYLPVRHASGPNLDALTIEGVLKAQLSRPSLNVVMHNAAFDMRFAAKRDIKFGGYVYDTMVMAAMVNEHSDSFSLAAQAQQWEVAPKENINEYLAQKFNTDPKDRSLMGRFWELPADDEMAIKYACGDGGTTWELYDALAMEITKQDMLEVWKVETHLTKILHEMSWRGVKIDEERLHTIDAKVKDLIAKAEASLPPNLNVKSPIQMEKLFRDHNITDWPLTEKGRPSFPESWLVTNVVGQLVVEARKWKTLHSSFIMPTIKDHLYNGRLHTEYNQLRADNYGTISGRLSSSNPNMFNYPSPKRQPEQGKLFRQIFVADDGMEMAEADYNQCEPRLVAHYANIRPWIDGYLADPPADAHDSVAKMTGLPRQKGKTISMALITGAGKGKIIDMMGLSEAEGGPLVDKYHAAIPEIKQFQRKATDTFLNRGWVKSILGRRFHLEDPRYAYRALSRIIQGSNADIVKMALVNCDKVAKETGAQLLNSIYDSIIWQAESTFVHGRMAVAMCDLPELKLRVPMAVDLGHGFRWSECQT
jgi:DNA polymerase-1